MNKMKIIAGISALLFAVTSIPVIPQVSAEEDNSVALLASQEATYPTVVQLYAKYNGKTELMEEREFYEKGSIDFRTEVPTWQDEDGNELEFVEWQSMIGISLSTTLDFGPKTKPTTYKYYAYFVPKDPEERQVTLRTIFFDYFDSSANPVSYGTFEETHKANEEVTINLPSNFDENQYADKGYKLQGWYRGLGDEKVEFPLTITMPDDLEVYQLTYYARWEPVKEVDPVICSVRISSDELSLSDGYSTDNILEPTSLVVEPTSSETVFGVNKFGIDKVTAMDALVEAVYYSLYNTDMNPETVTADEIELVKSTMGSTTNNGWVAGLYGIDNGSDYSWMYASGNSAPSVAVADYPVTEGDNLWFFYSDWTYSYRGYFDSLNYSTATDKELSVNVKGVPILSEMYGTTMMKDLEGAKVKVGDKIFTTDSKGNCVIKGLEAGTYTMSASWEDDTYGYYLVSPYATVTVAQGAITPEEPEDVDAYSDMVSVYLPKTITETSDTDISVMWEMLAKSSLNGITPISIDFASLNYEKMNAQKLAKVLIAMANNNYDVNSKLYNGKSIPEYLVSCMQEDGSFNTAGIKAKAQSTEQVFCIMALEIIDYPYDREKAFSYLESKQMASGAFGFGTFPDMGATSWVINAYALAGKSNDSVALKAKSYCDSNWGSVYESNDSSSMSAYVSALSDINNSEAKDKLDSLIEKSYNSEGKYFTWGTSTESNSYATSTSSQSLGDVHNGKSIYTELDDYYVGVYHSHEYTSKYDKTSHWEECSCGDVKDKEEHISDGGKITRTATEEQEGLRVYSCTVCGYELKTEIIPKIIPGHKHEYSDTFKYDEYMHWRECSCGDKSDIYGHTYSEWKVVTPATETAEGLREKTCKCGYKVTEKIPVVKPEHTHSFSSTWDTDGINHWHSCSCGEKSDIENHSQNEGVITKPATYETEGEKVFSCKVCGRVLCTESIPKLIKDPISYSILEGANSNWSGYGVLSFRSEADYSKFVRAEVDGVILEKKDYVVSQGSTVVTLNLSYLRTLCNGNHKITIVSEDGIAECWFSITSNANQGSVWSKPDTGYYPPSSVNYPTFVYPSNSSDLVWEDVSSGAGLESDNAEVTERLTIFEWLVSLVSNLVKGA